MVVGEIAVGFDVERVVVFLAANQKRALRPQGVADAEFVEDVGIVDGEVRDDEVGHEEFVEHVLANVAGFQDLSRRTAGNVQGLQGRLDELRFDFIEIDAFLGAERPNDKCLHGGFRVSRFGFRVLS